MLRSCRDVRQSNESPTQMLLEILSWNYLGGKEHYLYICKDTVNGNLESEFFYDVYVDLFFVSGSLFSFGLLMMYQRHDSTWHRLVRSDLKINSFSWRFSSTMTLYSPYYEVQIRLYRNVAWAWAMVLLLFKFIFYLSAHRHTLLDVGSPCLATTTGCCS